MSEVAFTPAQHMAPSQSPASSGADGQTAADGGSGFGALMSSLAGHGDSHATQPEHATPSHASSGDAKSGAAKGKASTAKADAGSDNPAPTDQTGSANDSKKSDAKAADGSDAKQVSAADEAVQAAGDKQGTDKSGKAAKGDKKDDGKHGKSAKKDAASPDAGALAAIAAPAQQATHKPDLADSGDKTAATTPAPKGKTVAPDLVHGAGDDGTAAKSKTDTHGAALAAEANGASLKDVKNEKSEAPTPLGKDGAVSATKTAASTPAPTALAAAHEAKSSHVKGEAKSGTAKADGKPAKAAAATDSVLAAADASAKTKADDAASKTPAPDKLVAAANGKAGTAHKSAKQHRAHTSIAKTAKARAASKPAPEALKTAADTHNASQAPSANSPSTTSATTTTTSPTVHAVHTPSASDVASAALSQATPAANAQPAASAVVHAQMNGPRVAIPAPAIAFEIRRQADLGINRFEIRLDPPDLGRIDVRMEMHKDGSTKVHLTADRQDTLNLLQGDHRNLERALNSVGLKADRDGLGFSLRQDSMPSGGGGGNGAQGQGWRSAGTGLISIDSLPDASTLQPTRRYIDPSRLDILV